MRVLVVDDEKLIRDVIKEYLLLENMEVDEASNGIEAIEKVKSKDFDIIIMDIMMPKMDGYTACREIKKLKDIPFIMLSARGEEYDKLIGFDLGIDDYVTKPFSPKELVARIKAITKRRDGVSSVSQIAGIKLDDIAHDVYVDGEKIEAECGVMLKEVSDKAIENSLTGFEFACGIPGTIGGAVFMNAGAYDGEISKVIESAEVIDENCNIIRLSREELDFGYRSSLVMKKGYTVLSAVFKLEKGQVKTIKELIEDLTNKRESKQPLEYPSAGSTFKRPTGYFAGKLIQDAGLKGYSIGGAAVSEKHSGFVINKGNATAKDITDLIKHIQDEVKKQFGVDLHPEVRIIGEE